MLQQQYTWYFSSVI